MDNAGGINRLWWIDSQYYQGLTTDALPELLLDDCLINEISFADDGGSLSITDREDDNGTAYNIAINLKVPKISATGMSTHSTLKEALQSTRVLLLARDNNDQFILIGGSGSYFNLTRVAETGAVMADMNMTRLQISADIESEPVFISDPLTASWSAAEIDEYLSVILVSETHPVLKAGTLGITNGITIDTSCNAIATLYKTEDGVETLIAVNGDDGSLAFEAGVSKDVIFSTAIVNGGATYHILLEEY